MAVKKPKAKAKRAAPKAKAKTRTNASKKAPRAKPKAKPKAKPTKKRSVQTAAAAAPPSEPVSAEPKKGPLARLAGGVGSLFARMTGKKASAPDEALAPAPHQTIELATGDILSVTDAPDSIRKPKS